MIYLYSLGKPNLYSRLNELDRRPIAVEGCTVQIMLLIEKKSKFAAYEMVSGVHTHSHIVQLPYFMHAFGCAAFVWLFRKFFESQSSFYGPVKKGREHILTSISSFSPKNGNRIPTIFRCANP